MENHQGIFICCTNLLPSMDRAAMRRFQWKIEFRALKDEAKLKLFMNYFCPKGQQLDESDARSVEEIADLTPGDIKAVWQRYNGLLGNSVTIKSIIRELEKEVLYRRGGGIVKVGFN